MTWFTLCIFFKFYNKIDNLIYHLELNRNILNISIVNNYILIISIVINEIVGKIMINKKFLLIFSCLLVALICINSVAAIEDVNIDDNNLTEDFSNQKLEIDESDVVGYAQQDNNQDNNLSVSESDEVLSQPQTIVIEPSDKDLNQMTNPTIQNAINSAKDGDTIIINGPNYVHCHFIIDKNLTIKTNVGTTMSPCSKNDVSGHRGIFYISPSGSGTVIEGFTISAGGHNDDDDYGILVRGASDVIIRNCVVYNENDSDAVRLEDVNGALVENVTLFNANNGLRIKSSSKVTVNGSKFYNSQNGINVVDSRQINILSNEMYSNKIAGISYSGNGGDLTISYNNITENKNGIRLTSSDNVFILSNYIAFNDDNGVYVDYNITKIEIKGNFFNQNKKWEVFNDFHVENINDPLNANAAQLEIIDNNYMINYGGYGTGDMDRPVWTQVYRNYGTKGPYNYDSVNDVYVYVGEGNGKYEGHQGIMFLAQVYEINEFVSCPNLYIAPQKVWSKTGNYELELSDITQIKKGVYSISIVNAEGIVASDLSSVPVTFYVNKAGNSATPQDGDVYKTVMMKNGTATVRFYAEDFKSTGNVITAVLPTPGTIIDYKVSKTFNVDDENIPGEVLNTTISISNLNIYPKASGNLIATLRDSSGNALANQTVLFTLNSRNYEINTDKNGQAKLQVSLSKVGTYKVSVSFAGDGVEYDSSSAQANVIVKKQNTKIVSSNVYMVPNLAEYYSIALRDASSGKAIANQKVTFTVNGKTYTRATNSKGVASIKLRFSKNKMTYKIITRFKGDNQYNGVSKTNYIFVKYSSKTAKLVAPSITILPKTAKYYTVSLKDANGKGIAKQKVTIKVNGKTYTRTTNAKGNAFIKVKFSSLKTYKVIASYKGSSIYKKASTTAKIYVAKASTKITAPTISILPKESKTYTITLKTNNKALAKQKVTIKINGKAYSRTTNAKGQASVAVKFTSEKSYPVVVNYNGNAFYKASKASAKINVAKITTKMDSYDRTFSKDTLSNYEVTLKDSSGNALANQNVVFTFNSTSYTQKTDSNGKVSVNLSNSDVGVFDIITKFAGSDKYKAISKTNKITVLDKANTKFVDSDLPNSVIQDILDGSSDGDNVEFLGGYYFNIALNVNKGLNIYSANRTLLNAKANSPVFNIGADNVNISGFTISGNSGDAINIINSKDVAITNNDIYNKLDEAKMPGYADGTVNMPGYGISISNSSDVKVLGNDISLFESAIFAEFSSDLVMDNNILRENNYGIKYGYGVSNTQITNNEISDNIGLYIMTVPEGPTGYGIFLNNSAVNVTINHNHIAYNHLGISVDANYSTGIVVTQNTITDNVLEGMRFNAGYDLAKNAAEPLVTDNAIYRNARGPSMMILGELSANPFGIYGNGLYNPEDRLKLDPNWYGTNNVVTWDNDTGVVGYGTMCPRINTTGISFNMTYNSPGNYSIKFYKNGKLASNLPEFDMYATLNNKKEINFIVVDGVGSFTFSSADYGSDNGIDISIGSLLNSTSRTFKVTYHHDVPESEIPK